jgi:uncharacterized membrane protein
MFYVLLLLPILSFVGCILFLVAMHGLANYYKDHSIFSNALYAFITGIVGTIAIIAIAIITLVAEFAHINTAITTPIPTASAIALTLIGF